MQFFHASVQQNTYFTVHAVRTNTKDYKRLRICLSLNWSGSMLFTI